jgi:hypothetical protein
MYAVPQVARAIQSVVMTGDVFARGDVEQFSYDRVALCWLPGSQLLGNPSAKDITAQAKAATFRQRVDGSGTCCLSCRMACSSACAACYLPVALSSTAIWDDHVQTVLDHPVYRDVWLRQAVRSAGAVTDFARPSQRDLDLGVLPAPPPGVAPMSSSTAAAGRVTSIPPWVLPPRPHPPLPPVLQPANDSWWVQTGLSDRLPLPLDPAECLVFVARDSTPETPSMIHCVTLEHLVTHDALDVVLRPIMIDPAMYDSSVSVDDDKHDDQPEPSGSESLWTARDRTWWDDMQARVRGASLDQQHAHDEKQQDLAETERLRAEAPHEIGMSVLLLSV